MLKQKKLAAARLKNLALAAATAAVLSVIGDQAHAALTHRFSFNDGTANDSIGGANGTLINPLGTATITGGSVNFANSGTSNDPFSNSYVDLPNNLGQTSSFTIEGWATWGGGNDWQRIFDFGNTTSGEQTPDLGLGNYSGTDQYYLTPRTGNDPGNNRLLNYAGEIRTASNGVSAFVNARNASNAAFNFGSGEHEFALTRDAASNTLSLYYDGVLVSQNTNAPQDPATMNLLNVWLGRSNWSGDPFYNGSINEFRIYDNALTAAQIANNTGFGPDSTGPTGTNIWQTAGSGNFATPAGWNQGHVPTATEQAIINNGAVVTANSNVGSNTVTQITSGTLTLATGAALAANIDLAPGNGPGTATLNLNGGVLTVGRIQVDSGNPSGSAAKTIAFNGGTLSSTGSYTLAGNNLTTTVGALGATVDVQGANNVVNWAPVLTPAGATAALTKTGPGTFNLTGGGYAARVTVKAGTLGVAGNVGVAATPLQLGDATAPGGDNATLSINGNATINSPIVAGTTTLAGAYTLNVGANANVSMPNPITMNQPLTISQVATSGSNTLTISGPIASATPTPKNLTFNNAGIVLVTAPISETPGGTLTLVKNNNGVLALLSPNTYSGPTQINTGGLLFAFPQSIGGTGKSVSIATNGVAGPGPGFDYTNLKGTFFNRIDPNSSGVVALTKNSAENFDFNAAGLNLQLISLGAATGSNSAYTGTITPANNTYRLGGGAGVLTLPNVNAVTGANSLIVGGAGGGTIVLGAANDFSGGTTITTANTLSVANPAALGSGSLIFNNGILQITGTTPFAYALPISLTDGGATVQVDNTAGATFSGGVSIIGNGNANNSPFTKTGAGNLTLLGSNDFGNNSIWIRNGTLTFDTGSVINSNFYNSIGQINNDTGTVVVQGDAQYTVNHDFNIGDVNNAKGTLFIKDNAVVNATTFYAGKFNAAQGVVVQTGGSLNSVGAPGEWRIGGGGGTADAAAVGAYDMSAGTFNTTGNFQIGAFGTGAMTISGGTATAATYPVVGRFPGGYGVLTVTGGSFNQLNSGTLLIVGEQGTGILNVSGTGVINTSGQLRVGHTASGVGIVNLGTGGLISVPAVSYAAGSATFNFHGGTLQTTLESPSFLQGLTNAYVYSEGAILDSNGANITVAQPLLAPTGSGVSAIAVANGGTGYLAHPVIQITGGGGVGATAVPIITNGVVTGIQITNPGTDYTSPATVTILGGGGTGATAGTVTLAANTSGGLTKVGQGSLTLAAVNTYAGDTVVNAGTLFQGVVGAIPSGAGKGNLVINGGDLFGGTVDLNGQDLSVNGLGGSTGAVVGQVVNNSVPATLTVGNNNATASFAGNISGDGIAVTKVSTGVQTLSGPNTYTGPTFVNAGTLRVTGNVASSSAINTFTGGTFEAASTQTIKQLVMSGGVTKVTGGGTVATARVLTVGDGTTTNSLSVSANSKIDLTTNAMVVNYATGGPSPLADVRSKIIAAYSNGTWLGNGIGSSSAAADTTKAVGYAEASQLFGAAGGTFLGTPVDGSSVVVRYTIKGDTDLDGTVGFSDLVAVAQHYGASAGTSTWFEGDVTYDGNVGFEDLVAVAQGYNKALPSSPIPGATAEFNNDLAAAFASVPEPGAFSLIAVAGALALRRRRRNCLPA